MAGEGTTDDKPDTTPPPANDDIPPDQQKRFDKMFKNAMDGWVAGQKPAPKKTQDAPEPTKGQNWLDQILGM